MRKLLPHCRLRSVREISAAQKSRYLYMSGFFVVSYSVVESVLASRSNDLSSHRALMIAMLQASSTPRIQVKYHIKNPLTYLVKLL
jgi:hypothetical protein